MERERITISIRQELLKQIDQTIDGTTVRNRSHAIESLVTASLGSDVIKDVVILAGGQGAIKNIPITKEIIKKLSDFGFEKIYVALGSAADKVKKSLGDGSDFGLELEYSEKGEGTSGALLPLRKFFKDSFIVVNPGDFVPDNLEHLSRFHRSHDKTATMLTNDLKELKGVYIFKPEIFNFIPDGFSMLEEDIFPRLIENYELIMYPAIGNLID